MRISDWSSDVCSSDLAPGAAARTAGQYTAARCDPGPDRPGEGGRGSGAGCSGEAHAGDRCRGGRRTRRPDSDKESTGARPNLQAGGVAPLERHDVGYGKRVAGSVVVGVLGVNN